MDEKLTLEWKYTPSDFFEAPLSQEMEGYKLEIDNGKITAHLSDPESDNAVFEKIHDKLNGLFLGAQLFEHKPYTLSDFAIIRTRSDGIRDIAVKMSAMATATVMGKADFIVRDADGNITQDSRAERIQARQNFAGLAKAL